MSIAQITSADNAYVHLDAFIAAPSPEKAKDFKHLINSWNPDHKAAYLAKVIAYCQLGFYESQFLEFQAAIFSYERAKMMFQQHALSGYDMVNSCYIPLGNLYTKTGALSEAENLIKEYIFLAQKTGRQPEIVAGLMNLSVVFQNQGDHQQAVMVLNEGLRLAPKNEKLQLNLVTSLLRTNSVEQAENIVASILMRDPKNVKALQLQAEIQLEKEDPIEAMKLLNRAADTMKKGNGSLRSLSKLRLSMASLALQLGEKEQALTELRSVYKIYIPDFVSTQSIPFPEQLVAENTLMDALDLHATLYKMQGKNAEAFNCYTLAFEVLDKLEASIVLQNSKLAQRNNAKIRSERTLDLLYTLFQQNRDTLWLSEALRIDQRSKSPLLLQARQMEQQLEMSQDTILVDQIQDARFRLSRLHEELETIKNSTILDIERLETVQQDYNSTTSDVELLLSKFATTDVQPNTPLSLQALMASAAKKQETVLSYFVGKEAIYQFVITAQEIEFNRIAESSEQCEELFQYCASMNTYFEAPSAINNNPMTFAALSNSLFNALEIPRTQNLVLITDGVLAYIPFSALLTAPTAAISYAEMPFLIRSSQISYALSLEDFLKADDPLTISRRVLGIFPVFANTDNALEYSVQEAAALEHIVAASVYRDESATTANFLNEAGKYNVIHISSHASGGSLNEPAQIAFSDGSLTVNQLYGRSFAKDLVVLSACETGVGTIIRGEGVQSMARAFQYTGAKNTLFSLWKVNDFTTAKLMEDFYLNLNSESTLSNALHRSKLHFLDNPSIDNSKKSPYFWAGFVYYGSTQTAMKSAPKMWLWLLLLPLLIWIFIRWKRQRTD